MLRYRRLRHSGERVKLDKIFITEHNKYKHNEMQLLHQSPFTLVFTTQQDLVIGLKKTICFQRKLEVQELAHIIISSHQTMWAG